MYPSNPHSKRWVVHIFTKQAHSLSGRGEWRMLLLGQQNHACRKRYLHTDFNHFLIAGPPRAEINSMQEKVNLGQNIKLNCPITGIPTPLYEWYKVSKYNLNENKLFFNFLPCKSNYIPLL